jgi:hypothetical protein
MKTKILLSLTVLMQSVTFAQTPQKSASKDDQRKESLPKQKMEVIAVFDAGQPDASIFKLYDKASGVICYLLAPDLALRKSGESGWSYESNSLGSLSCVKDVQAVIPVRPKEK